MRKYTWPLLFLAVCVVLAGCSGPAAALPTNSPTAVPAVPTSPVSRPTQGAVSNPVAGAGADLGSKPWKLTQVVSGAGKTRAVANSDQFTLQFEPAAGRLGIATACTSATGSYATDGHALKITLESSTNAVCPGDDLSGVFMAELSSVQSYSLDNGALVLNLGGAGGTLRLTH